MDRFLQEVTDEAHLRAIMQREVYLTSHQQPLSRERPGGVEDEKPDESSPGVLF